MRKMLIAVLVLAALYAGYWGVGAWAVKKGLTAWVEEQRRAGVTIDYSDFALRGFPSRFDVTLTDPLLADPATGNGWKAPFFQIFALSYQPQHYITVWPHEQVLTLSGRDIPIASTDMRASVVFTPGPSFVLNRTTLVAEGLSVDGDWGAQTFRFATKRSAGDELSHDIGIEGLEVAVPEAARARFDPNGTLPRTLERIHLDATVAFDRRLDRHILERQPEVTRLTLRDMTFTWDDLGLTLTGELEPDDNGLAEGTIRVKAQNWRRMVALAVDAGVLPEKNRQMTEAMLAGLSAGTETLDTPISFSNGRIMLGFFTLGPAPRLSLK